ncbi:MAG: ATP-dependent protease ATPase subunit HslU [Lactobacillus sp.]|nr:ATP-dependent protease ATPase subunit HslU [Lactobacillus sp.]
MTLRTPKEIVGILDQYIIGQKDAKKAVAVALYNRYRRMQLSGELQKEITPKNMLMAGPTGVGKTEIARRLAEIVEAPFVKVEATKFTEVGYVGRDVEAMVRDLVAKAVQMEEKIQFEQVKSQATKKANEIIAEAMVPEENQADNNNNNFNGFDMQAFQNMLQGLQDTPKTVSEETKSKRQAALEKIEAGLLEDEEVTVEIAQAPKANPMSDMMGQMGMDMSSMFSNMMPQQKVKRTLAVRDARELLIKQESANLVDYDVLYQKAIDRTTQNGIIFIDEIDKIAENSANKSSQVSRQGVQRDILPIVEGSTVQTKYGPVDTNHILFIAAGAFAESKPSDLIPELQGRFPIRVELNALTKDDFVKILTDPANSLLKQYEALLQADGVKLIFTQEAIDRIAQIAFDVNTGTDNIGARRLATILEKLLEDILYEAPDMNIGEIKVTEAYVNEKLSDIITNKDLTKFIL